MNRLATIIAAISLISGAAAFGAKGSFRDLPQGISLETAKNAEQKGDVANARSNYDLAVTYYQKALRSGGPDTGLYNKLGIAQLKQGNYNAARKSFQQALKLDPHNAYALNNLGALMCLEKKYRPALQYLRRALELDDSSANFHVNMAEAWAGLSQIERAMNEYERAMELDPDVFASGDTGIVAQLKSPAQAARMDYLIAKTFARRGNLDGALDYLRRAKENHYSQLGDVYGDKEFAVLWQDPRLAGIIKPE
jgi:tetratricopeptide (TPR) repeat protein